MIVKNSLLDLSNEINEVILYIHTYICTYARTYIYTHWKFSLKIHSSLTVLPEYSNRTNLLC